MNLLLPASFAYAHRTIGILLCADNAVVVMSFIVGSQEAVLLYPKLSWGRSLVAPSWDDTFIEYYTVPGTDQAASYMCRVACGGDDSILDFNRRQLKGVTAKALEEVQLRTNQVQTYADYGRDCSYAVKLYKDMKSLRNEIAAGSDVWSSDTLSWYADLLDIASDQFQQAMLHLAESREKWSKVLKAMEKQAVSDFMFWSNAITENIY
jgi:hypothetical protein